MIASFWDKCVLRTESYRYMTMQYDCQALISETKGGASSPDSNLLFCGHLWAFSMAVKEQYRGRMIYFSPMEFNF